LPIVSLGERAWEAGCERPIRKRKPGGGASNLDQRLKSRCTLFFFFSSRETKNEGRKEEKKEEKKKRGM